MSSSLVMPSSGAFVWRDGPATARFPDQQHGSLPIGCLAACIGLVDGGGDAEISWWRGREARASMREILRFTGDCSTARAPAREGGGEGGRSSVRTAVCDSEEGARTAARTQEEAEREGWLRRGLEGREHKQAGRERESQWSRSGARSREEAREAATVLLVACPAPGPS